MRHLLQPRVLGLACVAALVSALASYPRLALWLNRLWPIWYLEATLFLCGIILWGFVFAWHPSYTHRPVFVLKPELRLWGSVSLTGIVVAVVYHQWLDPALRLRMPGEYPVDLKHWLAAVLFSLAINQLFLVFAPFDWLMRLLKNRWVAISLTPLLGVGVLVLKLDSLTTPVPTLLLAALLTGKMLTGFLVVTFYLRGGVMVVWWWTVLLETRHLLNMSGNF